MGLTRFLHINSLIYHPQKSGVSKAIPMYSWSKWMCHDTPMTHLLTHPCRVLLAPTVHHRRYNVYWPIQCVLKLGAGGDLPYIVPTPFDLLEKHAWREVKQVKTVSATTL